MVQRLVVRAPLLQQLKIEVVLCCSAEQGINQSPSTIHKLHGHMCNFEGFSEVSPFTIVSWLNFMRRSASCKLKTACALLEVVSESARSAWTLQMVHRAQHVPLAPDQCYTRWKVQVCVVPLVHLCIAVYWACTGCMHPAPLLKEAQLMACPVGAIEVCSVYVQDFLARLGCTPA